MTMNWSLYFKVFHMVFRLMTPQEIRHVRLVCKALADIGACHGFRNLTVFLHQESFAALSNFANHRSIGPYINEIVYDTRTPTSSMGERPLSMPQYLLRTGPGDLRRRVQSCRENWIPSDAFEKDSMSDGDIRENYRRYLRAVNYEQHIMSTHKDFRFFQEVLPKFPGLRSVTISNGIAIQRSSPFSAFFIPDDVSHFPACDRQTRAVIYGLRSAQRRLESFWITGVNPISIRREILYSMPDVCPRLKSLKLWFHEELSMALITPGEKGYPNTGRREMSICLQNLPGIQVLHLCFCQTPPLPPRHAMLRDIYPIVESTFHRWHNLREVYFHQVVGSSKDFRIFFIQQRNSLKDLHLGQCKLHTSTWVGLLRAMRAVLKLQRLRLSGHFCGDSLFQGRAGSSIRRECWDVGQPDGIFSREVEYWFTHPEAFDPLTLSRIDSLKILENAFWI
ncbi:hypothetical protein F5Y11DRAFT_366027 [Daldinia sp. FL1419]|nr:hypothetical protein F5Y11DRAFT_366027 [Daldinia sp. FL1419]